MGCRAAKYDAEDGRYQCAVSGDGCIYMIPDSKRCAEEYGEGPESEDEKPSCEKCGCVLSDDDIEKLLIKVSEEELSKRRMIKVYTIYLDEDRGFTDSEARGLYSEVVCFADDNGIEAIQTEEDFTKTVESLNISERYIISSEKSTLEIVREEMSEYEFNNLHEWTGW